MAEPAVAIRQRETSGALKAAVQLEEVSKRFADVTALDDVDLEVGDGEFFSLLGPSGSGKTTCLRLIAGFEAPTAGRISLQGRDVTDLPPYERDVNTVFQDYALFPHMTVERNVEYGLMVKGVPRKERRDRASSALAIVRLAGLEGRKPHQLSGGQRQRVSLARALVNEPAVLLLDEPLGALDLKLRQQMQIELKSIQQRVGLTFIYVTHDQEEALTMSDRLAVLNGGRIEQVGSPADVYEKPASPFVAGFVGVSNILAGDAAHAVTGENASFTIRPEKIRVVDPDAAVAAHECSATGRVRDVLYVGAFTRLTVDLEGGGELVVTRQNLMTSSMEALEIKGKNVKLVWDRQHNRVIQNDSGSGGSEDPGEEGP